MVFARFFAGIGCGIVIPMVVHQNIHYTIAAGFLMPHLRYQQRKELRDK